MDNVRVLRLPALPRKFAEVNLRFYVRFAHEADNRTGVVFLSQLVSNRFVALAGRRLFREPMRGTMLSCRFEAADPSNGHSQRSLHYRWRNGSRDEELRLTARGNTYMAEPGSLDEFVTARHWGFTAQSEGRIRAYRISREPWLLVPVIQHELECDFGTVCGREIADAVAGPPASALLATGSETRIYWPTRLSVTVHV